MAEGLEIVSVEQDGRTLSGVGTDAATLEKVMERHAPEPIIEPTSPEQPAAIETKKTRGQKRFDELTGEREAARREADTAKQEAAALKAELELLKQPKPAAAVESQRQPIAAVQPAAPRVKPTEEMIGTTYQTLGEFVEDLADWKAEQRLSAIDFDARIRSSIEADRASRSQLDHVEQAHSRGQKVYSDFDAVLNAPHMLTANWPLEKIQVIAALEEPEHIQYALGKDPTLAARLLAEPNLARFGMELAKLIPAAAVASTASTGLTGSVAPPPYVPVGSGSKTTVPPSADLVKRGFDFDKSGYRERRAAERGLRRMK